MKKSDDVARAIIAFNPDTKIFNHVVIGINAAMPKSPSKITWRDIQKLAEIALKVKSK